MGAFVVRMGDSSKSFLSGGIPDLKLVLFTFKFYLLKFIINAYSCHMGKCKVVIRKSEQQAGLSDSGVPYNHHLKSFHFLIIEANSCITSKMEKMKSYEEELVELQRKYLTPGSPDKSKRATGKDNFNMSQRTSGVQSTSSIPKSMTNVDVTDRLRAKIEKERQRGQELDEQISNYQDSIQDQRRQIAGVSKRGENKQDQSVASYLRSTQAQPNSFTGMGSSQQNYRQLAKQKEILENRLNKATQRYN